jgi:hypothetical protein
MIPWLPVIFAVIFGAIGNTSISLGHFAARGHQVDKTAPPSSVRTPSQSIHGTVYENQTAHFVLTVPSGWFAADIQKQLPQIQDAVGGLAAPGGVEAIMIQRYNVKGAKNAAQILETSFRNSSKEYRKTAEGPMVIDKRDAYSFTFRAVFQVGAAKLLIVLISDGQTALGFTCEAPESHFDHFGPIFEKIVKSFHSTIP